MPRTHPRDPVSAYGRTKAEGEQRAIAAHPDGTIVVRTAWLYGAGGPNFLKTMLRLAGERETLTVVDDQVGQPTWARDLAAQIVALLDAGVRSGIFHGTNGGQTSWWGFARAIFSEAGLDPERVLTTDSSAFPQKAPRPAYSVLGHDAWASARSRTHATLGGCARARKRGWSDGTPMTTLRVIIDQIVSPVPGGIGRYAEELTRALIATAPRRRARSRVSCRRRPKTSTSTSPSVLPGLAALYKSPLDRRSLAAAWQHGFTKLPGRGMIHAMSLLAPLHKHDRVNENEQIAVTIHDAVPWTHPETLTSRSVSWHVAMAKRAQKHADAIVVPSHAVATQLREHLDLGDRVRVIGGAVSANLRVPDDADARADAMGLPPNGYVLAVGTLEPRKGLDALITAMAHADAPDIPLIIAGPDSWGDLSVERLREAAGLPEWKVRALGHLADEDLAVALRRATVMVFPSRAEGFGLPVIEAFALGTPGDPLGRPGPARSLGGCRARGAARRSRSRRTRPALADAIARVVGDDELRGTMRTLGQDRSRAFSWTATRREGLATARRPVIFGPAAAPAAGRRPSNRTTRSRDSPESPGRIRRVAKRGDGAHLTRAR